MSTIVCRPVWGGGDFFFTFFHVFMCFWSVFRGHTHMTINGLGWLPEVPIRSPWTRTPSKCFAYIMECMLVKFGANLDPGWAQEAKSLTSHFWSFFVDSVTFFLSHVDAPLGSHLVQIGSKLHQYALDDVCKAFRRYPSPLGSKGDLWKSTQSIYSHVCVTSEH